jgi:predicted MFS family arabinose efflux permease
LGGAGPGSHDAAGFAWVMAGQVVVAAAQPLLLNSVTALARRYLRPEDRPAGIAIGSSGTFVGFVLAFALGAVFGAARLDLLLVIGAAYAVAGAAVLVVVLVAVPCADQEQLRSALTGLREVRRLWSDPVLRRLLYFGFVGFGVFVSLTTWAQALLKPAGVSAATTDTLLMAMVLGGVVSSAVLPPVVAQKGLQLPALVTGGVMTIAACALLAAAPGVASGAAAMCAVGFFLLPGLPIMLEVAERRSGDAAVAAGALLWLAGQAGGIVVALVSGAVEGIPWLAFAVLAAVVVLVAPAAARLRGSLAT